MGQRRGKHSGGSEGSKGIGIERGREDVGEFAGHVGRVGIVGVNRIRNWMRHGGGGPWNRCIQHGG